MILPPDLLEDVVLCQHFEMLKRENNIELPKNNA